MTRTSLDAFARNLESKQDPKNAEFVKKYMKSRLRFYGLKIPMVRKLVSDFIKHNPKTTPKELYPGLNRLWNSRVFEQMAAAIFILEKFSKDFDETTWKLMDGWIDGLDNWALCDWLCSLRVKMADKDRKKLTLLMEWTETPYLWRRRSAIISTLKLKRFNTTLKLDDIRPLLLSLMKDRHGYGDRKEFFIQKAIGWLLRSYGDFEPRAVLTFANTHRSHMSPLAYREATRKLQKP